MKNKLLVRISIGLTFFAFLIIFVMLSGIRLPSKPLPKPSPSVHPDSLTEDHLWMAVRDWRISQKFQPYTTDQRLCSLAEVRLKEIKTDYSHNGFYKHLKDFSYVDLGENLAKDFYSTNKTLSNWLNSPSHRENLDAKFTYSCIRTDARYVVQIFGNF